MVPTPSSRISEHRRSAWAWRYAAAIIAAAAGFGLRSAVTAWVGQSLPAFITFYPFIMLVALLAGWGPGLLATALVTLATVVEILPPIGHFTMASLANRVAAALFCFMGVLMSAVAELYRRNRVKAAAYDRERAVRESRREAEFLAIVLDRSRQPFAVGYPDGRFGLFNQAFEQLTGYTATELRALSWSTALTPPEWREAEKQKLDELHRTGEPVRYEKEYIRKDGSRVPIELLVHLAHDDEGGIAYYYSFLNDTTERKRAERAIRQAASRFEVLSQTAGELLRSDQPERVVNETCRKVMEHLDCHVFVNYLIGDRAGRLHLNASGGLSEQSARAIEWLNFGEAICGRVAESGERIIAQNIQESCDPRADLVRSLGIRAYACHPILAMGRVMGTLSFGTRSRTSFSDEDLALMKTVTDQVAIAIQRVRAHEALLQSRQDLDRAQAVGQIGSWRLDTRRNVLTWSDENHRIFGMPKGAPLTYETFLSIVHPDDRGYVDAEWKKGLQGEPYDIEHRIVSDGRVKWVREKAFLEFDDAGGLIGGFGITQDLTKRKEAELALRNSEAMLAQAEQLANVGCWEWHPQTGKLTWSRHLYRMFNVDPDKFEPTYERFLALISEDDRPRIRDAAARTLATGEPFDEDFSIMVAEAGLRYVHSRGEVFLDATGRPVRLTGTVLDMTERKAAEAALRNSERLYRGIGETINYGIWVCAPDGRNIYASESFLDLVGMTQEQCSNFGWGDVLHPDDTERTIAAWKECVRTGGLWDIEHRFRGVDGKWHAVLARGAPIRDDRGEITCWAGINLDINRLKSAEEQLRATAAELARSNEELEQFAYVASHDLQEPLRHVAGYMQLLKKRYGSRLDATADEFIQFAVDGASRMSQLIQDLLAYSRVGTRGKEPQPVDSRGTLKEVLATLGLLIDEKHTTITSDPLPVVCADASQLAQLLQNLIGNAIKFHGDTPPRIHVGVRPVDGMWEFAVSDSGIGIDSSQHERIFRMFQRLHTSEQYPGTGIGLAICRKIVERHGGRIWVESNAGEGAVFRFTLPAPPSIQQ